MDLDRSLAEHPALFLPGGGYDDDLMLARELPGEVLHHDLDAAGVRHVVVAEQTDLHCGIQALIRRGTWRRPLAPS